MDVTMEYTLQNGRNGNLRAKTMGTMVDLLDQWTSGTLYFQTKASKLVTRVGNSPMEEEPRNQRLANYASQPLTTGGLSSNLEYESSLTYYMS